MHPMQLPALLLLRGCQLAAHPLHCRGLAFQPAHRLHQEAAHQLLPFDWGAHGPLALQIALCFVQTLPAITHCNHTLQSESKENLHVQNWYCI